MSDMQKFTLTLHDDAAERIAALVAPYQGSVPGYAATWAAELSKLPISDQEEIRMLVDTKIRLLVEAGLRDAPKIPAVPPQLASEARKLLAQVSPPPQPARKPRSRPGTPNGKAG